MSSLFSDVPVYIHLLCAYNRLFNALQDTQTVSTGLHRYRHLFLLGGYALRPLIPPDTDRYCMIADTIRNRFLLHHFFLPLDFALFTFADFLLEDFFFDFLLFSFALTPVFFLAFFFATAFFLSDACCRSNASCSAFISPSRSKTGLSNRWHTASQTKYRHTCHPPSPDSPYAPAAKC